jgi:hypothetical protein
MADFYSPMLTENADGTPTDFHSLGSSSNNGLSRCVHNISLDVAIGTKFDLGDKIVLAIVPANFKMTSLNVVNNAWKASSLVKTGIYSVNNDGTVGAAASALSDVAFEITRNLVTPVTTFTNKFGANAAILGVRDVGKQMWELVNLANAGTYPESPGGNFAIVMEFQTTAPVTSTAIQTMDIEIVYNDIN